MKQPSERASFNGGLTQLRAVIFFEVRPVDGRNRHLSLSASPDGASCFVLVPYIPVINLNIRCGTIGIPVCYL